MPEYPSIWQVLSAVGGVSTVVTLYLLRAQKRKVEAEGHLTESQAEEAEANAGKIEAERDHITVETMVLVVRQARDELSREEGRRKALEAEVKLLEDQLRREAAFRESHGLKLLDE